VHIAQAVNTAHRVSTASTQVNAAYSTNIDNLSDVVIYAFFASQPNSPQLVHEDLQQIHPYDMEEMDLKYQMAMLTMRARRFLKNIEKKLTINGDETIGETAIRELRKKLEIVQKKDGIQLNVDKFKHASKSVNKLIECQIVNNCKKGLGYENYNAVPPTYTRKFMPSTPDLSFTGLDEFVNEPVVENCKAMFSEGEPKVVRKYDDAPSIKELVLDDEEEDVSQLKIKKKKVRPSIVKIEFIKSKQQQKTTRKTVKQVEQHRQNTQSP
nr:hypothetical protein [Tanacetum cinerariifolium]